MLPKQVTAESRPRAGSRGTLIGRKRQQFYIPKPDLNCYFVKESDEYYLNKVRLSDEDIKTFTSRISPVPTGNYWYDKKCGLWGRWGMGAISFAKANVQFINEAPLDPDCSHGDLDCWVNERRLTESDILLLQSMGVPCTPGRWWIDENGNVGKHPECEIRPSLLIDDNEKAVLQVKVFLSQNEKYFNTHISLGKLEWTTEVEYKQLKDFQKRAKTTFPSIEFAKLPSKDRIKKSPLELETYLLSMFSIRVLCENIQILRILGITSALVSDIPDHLRLYQAANQLPLIELSEVTRNHIAKFYLFLANPQWFESGEFSKYFPGCDKEYLAFVKPSKKSLKFAETMLSDLFERIGMTSKQLEELKSNPSQYAIIAPSVTKLNELDYNTRWSIVWELLLQSLCHGAVDSRTHVSVQQCANLLGISLHELAVAEGECAVVLQRQLVEMERITNNNESKNRWIKVGIGAAIGGGVMFVAGLLALPLLIPLITIGVGLTATTVALLPLVGATLSTGVVMAGAALASAAQFIPIIFAAGGAGLIGYKVAHITQGIDEFEFERVPTAKEDDMDDDEDKPEDFFYVDFDNKIVYDKRGKKVIFQGNDLNQQAIIDLLNQTQPIAEVDPLTNKIQLKSTEQSIKIHNSHQSIDSLIVQDYDSSTRNNSPNLVVSPRGADRPINNMNNSNNNLPRNTPNNTSNTNIFRSNPNNNTSNSNIVRVNPNKNQPNNNNKNNNNIAKNNEPTSPSNIQTTKRNFPPPPTRKAPPPPPPQSAPLPPSNNTSSNNINRNKNIDINASSGNMARNNDNNPPNLVLSPREPDKPINNVNTSNSNISRNYNNTSNNNIVRANPNNNINNNNIVTRSNTNNNLKSPNNKPQVQQQQTGFVTAKPNPINKNNSSPNNLNRSAPNNAIHPSSSPLIQHSPDDHVFNQGLTGLHKFHSDSTVKSVEKKDKDKKNLPKQLARSAPTNGNTNNDESKLTEEEMLRIETAGMEVVICVNGWVWEEKEITKNFNTIRILNPAAEVYSLRWQTEELLELGRWVTLFICEETAAYVVQAIICALSATAAATFAALAIPLYILFAAKFLDNPWTVVGNHAKRAGKLLYETLRQRPHGTRPVTLIGWSHGARLIFSALEYLAKCDHEDYRGIVENVFLIGAPVTTNKKRWKAVRPLIAGRFVNVYSKRDYFLSFLYRGANARVKTPSGVVAMDVEGVENIDVTEIILGSINYNRKIKKILELLNLESSIPSSFFDRTFGSQNMVSVVDTEVTAVFERERLKALDSNVQRREEQKLLKQQAKVERKVLKKKDKLDKKAIKEKSNK